MSADIDRTRRPFLLEDAIGILARTPATLDSLLRGLPVAWLTANEGGDTWSPFDIVGHLIHGEQTDWMPRARIILEHGDTRAFERFDRLAQFDSSAAQTVESRLDEFASLRRRNLEELKSLELTNSRSRSCGSPSRARSGHAAAAPGDVDRARPRSRHADLARAWAAVFRRGRPVARLFADRQRHARVVADCGHARDADRADYSLDG